MMGLSLEVQHTYLKANMKMPNKPKGKKALKDPVLMMGKWEERVPPPPTAGTTMIDVNDPDCDPEDKRGKAGLPYRPAGGKKGKK